MFRFAVLLMVVMFTALSGCERAAAPVADPQVVTVSGRAQVETATGDDVPLRQTQVEAVSASDQAVLFSTWTDAEGAYTLVVPADTAFTVRASSRADSGDDSGWSVSVETSAGDLYQAEDSPAAASAIRDLYVRGEAAGAFLLLDHLQGAYDAARQLWPEGTWPPLAAILHPGASGAYQLDNHGLLPTLVLPRADPAAAVEGFARYLQLYAFRDERPVHGEAIDDPRTQFSNAFGAALANYLLAQAPNLEPRSLADPLGALLDDIMQGREAVGLTATELSALLNAPELLEFSGAMTAHAFVAAFKQAYPERGPAVDSRAQPLGITADPFAAELSAGEEPLYVTLEMGESVTVCGGSIPGAPGATGHRLVRVHLPENGRYRLSAVDAGSALPRSNPELILYRAGVQSLAGFSQQTKVEVVEHSLAAGDYLLDVFDRGNADGDALTGGRACFAVAVQATDAFDAPTPAPACDNLASLTSDARCQAPVAPGASAGF